VINLFDPGLWPKIRDRGVIDHLIPYFRTKFSLHIILKMKSGRHFSDCHYFRKLTNNEFVLRRWLMYSETTGCVFCFCCLCFDQGSRTCLANDGFSDLAHLSTGLKSHESSSSHMNF
jgi:hypothetical protein